MDDQVREPQSAARCPMSSGTLGNTDARTAATGAAARCPVQHGSPEAAAFDAFEGPYQVDPAAALRWFRDREPVFFSPKLGYWVVSRYEDVKAVFRDTGSFSPSIALEKVTPNTEAANAILARHGHADEARARQAFGLGLHEVLPDARIDYRPPDDWKAALDRALPQLDLLLPVGKECLVQALVRVISADGLVTLAEAELLRTVCAALHCPLPPLLQQPA